MAPPLPSWAAAWLLARESDDPAIALLTATHADWAEDYRLALNTEDVVSDGLTYKAAYFATDIVTDSDDAPRATLTIPNVNREIGLLVEGLTSAPEITISVISAANPDDPVYTASNLLLRGVSLGALAVSGTLMSRDYSSETCGSIRVVPGVFPALFLVR